MRKKYDKVGNKTAYKEKGKEKKSARKNIEMVNHIQLAKNYGYCFVSLFFIHSHANWLKTAGYSHLIPICSKLAFLNM